MMIRFKTTGVEDWEGLYLLYAIQLNFKAAISEIVTGNKMVADYFRYL